LNWESILISIVVVCGAAWIVFTVRSMQKDKEEITKNKKK